MRNGSAGTQKGLPLAETMIGLGVAAVLGALCFWAVPKIEENSKVAEANEQLGGIASSARGAFRGAKSFAGLTTAGAVKGKLYYPGMETDGKQTVYNGCGALRCSAPTPARRGPRAPGGKGTCRNPGLWRLLRGFRTERARSWRRRRGAWIAMVVVNGFDGGGQQAIGASEATPRARGAAVLFLRSAQVQALAPGKGKGGRLAGNVIQLIGK